MAANYDNELDALNALNDKVEAVGSTLGVISGKVATETTLSSIKTTAGNIKTNTDTLVGATPDVRHQVTNVRIERIYIGDVAEKREKAEAQIADLISKGYRPYMTLGVSEDLARVVFAKYPAPNNQ